ncbi:MAG TPA: SMR family transporter [Anaerolineales bacterium]|nr:SMR family transporter [Anaerolineales bacterium]
MIKPYVFLLIAILSEVAASTALRATKGFTQLVPSIITIVGYAISFYALSYTLGVFKLGITYAIWSGVGMVLITILGWLIYGQKMDWAGLLGIALIIAGVVIIQLFSEQTV